MLFDNCITDFFYLLLHLQKSKNINSNQQIYEKIQSCHYRIWQYW